MALIQQKTASLLLSQMGKQPVKISLFDATQWDSPGAVKGTFRVLLDRSPAFRKIFSHTQPTAFYQMEGPRQDSR